jgi:dTDP-4-dehydrorhamnose reductase
MAVSPTYVPDLVHTCLDLAIDGESGVWHLANVGTLTWVELAERAAARAGVDASRLEAIPTASCGFTAARPRYTGLHSERGILMPALDHALARYLELRNEIDEEMEDVILMAESRQA